MNNEYLIGEKNILPKQNENYFSALWNFQNECHRCKQTSPDDMSNNNPKFDLFWVNETNSCLYFIYSINL